MRAIEGLATRLKDIDFSTRPTKIHIRKEYAKTRAARDIYISDEATHYLKQWLEWKYDNKCDDNKNKQGEVKTFNPKIFIFSVYTTKNGRADPKHIYIRIIDEFTKLYIQRDEVIQEHLYTKKPTVLISPSLHTGLDLKEDLSRFQIITKVPYPNKSDRWINAKRNKVPEWYYWQTALKLVQAYGRSVRSKDDRARTYILDSAFQYFLRKNRDILPDWFLKAVKNYNLTFA